MIAFYLFGDFRFQPWLKIIVAVPFETCSWLKNKKSGSGVVRVTDGTESYKKVITLLLVAVLSWICVASGVCAAEEKQPTIQVENISAAAGETAEVKISIKNNPGILGAKLTLSFAEGLKLISAESGEAFSALTMTKPGELVSPCNFMWDGQELEESDIKDGTILTLKFLVEEAVPRGTKLAVSFSNEGKSVVDGALKPIPLQINNGNVAVRISVRNNPGILGLKIRLSYNDDALTLTKAVSGEAFDNYLTMTPPRKFTSGCNLLWDGVEIQTEDVRDGDIVTLWTHS